MRFSELLSSYDNQDRKTYGINGRIVARSDDDNSWCCCYNCCPECCNLVALITDCNG